MPRSIKCHVSRGNKGRPIEASIYRESYSGRIAAVYNNDSTRFGAHHYCLIPKYGFRHKFDCDAVERFQVILVTDLVLPSVKRKAIIFTMDLSGKELSPTVRF